MSKGMHTAGLAVLFRDVPPMDALAPLFPGARRLPASDGEWMGGPGGWVAPLPSGGRAVVTPFASPWPDSMGNPRTEADLFGAWTLGFFGPFAWPGALERASQQRWAFPGASEAVAAHRGFVRLLATQATGAAEPVLPEGYDALAELRELSALAEAVAGIPGAVAFFAPSGEVLLAPEALPRVLRANEVPLDAWSQVRLFRVEDGWTLMDTVGLGQLDRLDFEAVAPPGADPSAVAEFLRDASMYALDMDPEFADGNTVDGAGHRWVFERVEAKVPPMREAWRLVPEGHVVPASLAPPPPGE